MAEYITFSMPRRDAERLLVIAEQATAPSYDFPANPNDDRIVARLRANVRGKDLRITNRHNTHEKRPPKPRVGLDLRRKSA